MTNEDLRKQLYDLRQQGRERYLQLMDIDVGQVRELESDINAQYENLAVTVQGTLKDLGQDEAAIHTKSLERARTLIADDVKKATEDTNTILAILKRPVKDLLAEDLAHLMFRPVWRCVYLGGTASPVSEPTDEVDLNVPPPSGGASGSVTYNAADNIAHPKAEAQGMGTGTVNTATVSTSFRFSFMPETDRSYCIRPFVYMNGHWLVWTWGSCAGVAEDLGSGAVAITLRVRVDQLSLPVKEIEYKVLEQTASGGQNFESGFAYDSEVDGGAIMQAYLQGGHEAVVWVECKSYAEITNRGRAWVDMQTSPSFYFMVPEVWWGWASPWAWPFP